MPEKKLQFDFEQPNVHAWEKVAQQELGNKNPWQSLTKVKAGVTVKPYYDAADVVTEKKIVVQRVATPLQNVPHLVVIDAKKANTEALIHLNGGADGVWFEIQSPLKISALLKGIELPFCSVFFTVEDVSPFIIESLVSYVEKKSWQKEVQGAFFFNEFNENILELREWKKFHAHGIIVKENTNIVDEIVDSLLMTVDIVERLIKNNFSVEEAFRSIAFSISVNENFFLSIAKIRALRNLWLTLQEVYLIKNPSEVFIHAHSKKWINENYQLHSNMLKQTTAAMAATLAGCNALTVEPENENPMEVRIARNVSLLLQEESHLSKVSDPLAGSYYIDSLTHQIANEVWKKFQQHA